MRAAGAFALAGALVVVASALRDARAAQHTHVTLVALASACERFFEAAGRLPGSAAELEPYLAPQPPSDGWRRPFSFYFTPQLCALRSAGANARQGDSDDVCALVGIERLRRAETHARLVRLNAAIVRYNAHHQLDAPLPAEYPALLRRLVRAGCIEADPELEHDAWGEPFVEDPRGQVPVVRVGSRRLGPWRGR